MLFGGRVPFARNEQPFEVKLRDRGERREVLERRAVDDVEQRALAVEQFEDAVELVGDLVQALEELRMIDLEHRGERRELFQQPSPFIDAPHPLHQETLRGDLDDVIAPY